MRRLGDRSKLPSIIELFDAHIQRFGFSEIIYNQQVAGFCRHHPVHRRLRIERHRIGFKLAVAHVHRQGAQLFGVHLINRLPNQVEKRKGMLDLNRYWWPV